jgi:hypothetical protein
METINMKFRMQVKHKPINKFYTKHYKHSDSVWHI